ncbi:hypothetical protein [Sphingomonas japonica]|uniref:Antitoxin ParD1/3/4 n=1 Tax=Sphingomonas japonica TaxID=511662 RepID=A0ABX0U417_9SPHN|nr:hypothetical protein [Sphingomonas japonica]NIJ24790.1 hypothetical protein [Sphingomonas japonica]
MTREQTRATVADDLERTHDNQEFIRQVREGEQDDGPFMRGALAIVAKLNAETNDG